MTEITCFDESLQQKLMKVEEDLLDAALDSSSSPSAMVDFVEHLSLLMQSATHGIANRLLSSTTIALVRRVASSASSMAENLHDMERRKREIENRRQAELNDVFSRFSLRETGDESDESSCTAVEEPAASRRSKKPSLPKRSGPTATHRRTPLCQRSSSEETLVAPSSSAEEEGVASHIPEAYEWLKSNISNPYPSNAVKSDIAASSGVQLKTVTDWFTNVRRRIGWSKVVKRHFRGQRVLAVDAASRVFSTDSSSAPVPIVAVKDFLEVERVLHRLYDGKLEASEYAKQLPIVVQAESESVHPSATKKRSRDVEQSDPSKTECSSQSRKRKHIADNSVEEVISSDKRIRPLPRKIVNVRVPITSRRSSGSSSSSTTPEPNTPPVIATPFDYFGIDSKHLTGVYDQFATTSQSSVSQLLESSSEVGIFSAVPVPKHTPTSKRPFSSLDEIDAPAAKRSRLDIPSVPDILGQEQHTTLDNVFEGQDISQVIAGLDFNLPLDSTLLSDPLLDGNLTVDLHNWNWPITDASSGSIIDLGFNDFDPSSMGLASGSASDVLNLPVDDFITAYQNMPAFDLSATFPSEINTATPNTSSSYDEALDASSLTQLLTAYQEYPDNVISTDIASQGLLYPPIMTATDSSVEAKKEMLRQLREEASKIEQELAMA